MQGPLLLAKSLRRGEPFWGRRAVSCVLDVIQRGVAYRCVVHFSAPSAAAQKKEAQVRVEREEG